MASIGVAPSLLDRTDGKPRVGRGRGLGGEIRYQRAAGDLGSDFPADRIDLGGLTCQVVFRLRF